MQRVLKAKAIVKEMTGNEFFLSPSPTLASVTGHINTLVNTETAAQAKTDGAVQARDAALEVVFTDLRHLTAYVQSVADARPSDAETIIRSAGLDVKKTVEINKQDFIAKNGAVSGTVELIAKGAGKRSAHEWRMSADRASWEYLDTTLRAKTQVSGLTPGTKMFFRHRVILKEGPGAWSQTVSITVT